MILNCPEYWRLGIGAKLLLLIALVITTAESEFIESYQISLALTSVDQNHSHTQIVQFLTLINSIILDKENRIKGESVKDFKDYQDFQFQDQESKKMAMARNAMNPSHYVRTIAGLQMPKIIYGTAWKKERTADLVFEAIKAGFRGIDTACQPKHYNEKGVGDALKRLANEGIPRDSLYIQTKFTSVDGQDPNSIPYDRKANLTTQVQQSLNVSLSNLGVGYLDCLVLHSPLRTIDETLQVWRTFESFTDTDLDGLVKVRQLGISNCYSLATFQKIYDAARVKPAVLQNRLYADTDYDRGLRDFCKTKGIFYQSFWTLSANPTILRNKNVQAIAAEHGKTVEQIFFAYLINTGVITPLTGTTSKQHMLDDLEAVSIRLTKEQTNVFDDLMM